MISDKTGVSPFGSRANPDDGLMIRPDSDGAFGDFGDIGSEQPKSCYEWSLQAIPQFSLIRRPDPAPFEEFTDSSDYPVVGGFRHVRRTPRRSRLYEPFQEVDVNVHQFTE